MLNRAEILSQLDYSPSGIKRNFDETYLKCCEAIDRYLLSIDIHSDDPTIDRYNYRGSTRLRLDIVFSIEDTIFIGHQNSLGNPIGLSSRLRSFYRKRGFDDLDLERFKSLNNESSSTIIVALKLRGVIDNIREGFLPIFYCPISTSTPLTGKEGNVINVDFRKGDSKNS